MSILPLKPAALSILMVLAIPWAVTAKELTTVGVKLEQDKAATPLMAQTVEPSEQEVLLEVEGVLEPGDTTANDGRLYDEHTFEGQAGQAVVITLESDEFDTYLLLIDESGKILAQNDDIDSSTNSMVALVLPSTGNLSVGAIAYSAIGQGAYRLAAIATTADSPIADCLTEVGETVAWWELWKRQS